MPTDLHELRVLEASKEDFKIMQDQVLRELYFHIVRYP